MGAAGADWRVRLLLLQAVHDMNQTSQLARVGGGHDGSTRTRVTTRGSISGRGTLYCQTNGPGNYPRCLGGFCRASGKHWPRQRRDMEPGDLLGNPESRYGEVFRMEILSRVIQMSSLESAHMTVPWRHEPTCCNLTSLVAGVRHATRFTSSDLTPWTKHFAT